ncbi:MAG: hypothetical protein GXY96_09280, partial [Tissierellia bacterium]|nr:hypothetical protein [Tissierellia bacterium]
NLPKDAVEFKGVYELDGNTYIQLGDKAYPYVGEAIVGIDEGDMVIPTFITIRGETVVTKIEKVEVEKPAPEPEPEPEEPEDPEDPEVEVSLLTSPYVVGGIDLSNVTVNVTVVSTNIEGAAKFEISFEVDGVIKVLPENGPEEFGESVLLPALLVGQEVTVKLYNADEEHIGDYTVVVPPIQD